MEFSLIKFDHKIHLNFLDTLTELLHKAYAPLAKKGMLYLASHQKPEKTLERLLTGESYLVFKNDKLIGTVSLYLENPTSSCIYYRKKGVYSFGQFAIDPKFQGLGFGSNILNHIEQVAKKLGAAELALDTSEKASSLINFYKRRGYIEVDYTKWAVTNYRSVILSKRLETI